MSKLFLKLAVALLVFAQLMSQQAMAWGQNGHRIIGKIAEWHLTPATLAALKPLLSGDKLAEVTTWADEMRSNPDEFWQKVTPKWHYISLDSWKDLKTSEYPQPYKGEIKDIYSGILKCIYVLQDDSFSIEEKQLHFRFLTHLVGDLHQPLHVGRAADKGGNTIKVKFFREEVNLHWLWDSKLIDSQQLSFREYADFIDTKDQTEISEYLNSSVKDWVKESFEQRKAIYDIGNGKFSFNYKYKHMPTVDTRLLQAGVRLAGLLNQLFDPEAQAGINSLTYNTHKN